METLLGIPFDHEVALTDGSPDVQFSQDVSPAGFVPGVIVGTKLLFSSQPATIYTVASVAGDGRSAVLTGNYVGASTTSASAVLYGVLPSGGLVIGTAPMSTGAKSVDVTLSTPLASSWALGDPGGSLRLVFDSQPGNFYQTTPIPNLSAAAGDVVTFIISPPYSGPNASGARVLQPDFLVPGGEDVSPP
ncbi:MAG TPA: hypothetical protein VGG39_24950 [Polyangiaceae bacterium]|jgi:hypothetical protein